MKKCHTCDGKGFELLQWSTYKLKVRGFGLYSKSAKVPCKKCYGKGRR